MNSPIAEKKRVPVDHWLGMLLGAGTVSGLRRRWHRLRDKGMRRLSLRKEDRQQRIAHRLAEDGVATVRGGPFTGMKMALSAASLSLTSKIAGSYEAELHGVFERLALGGYETVVDLGCAEGYYAVGVARLVAPDRVIAIDVEENALRITSENARLNGVADRVFTCGGSSHASISASCIGQTLLICDVEGAELQLLDPNVCPVLCNVDLIVEIHDVPPGDQIARMMSDRFEKTHRIEWFRSQSRDANDWSSRVPELNRAELAIAIDELRPFPMSWLFAAARNKTHSK